MNYPSTSWHGMDPCTKPCEVYMSQWFGELIHVQGLNFSSHDITSWWAWTLTPPVIPEGGAW